MLFSYIIQFQYWFSKWLFSSINKFWLIPPLIIWDNSTGVHREGVVRGESWAFPHWTLISDLLQWQLCLTSLPRQSLWNQTITRGVGYINRGIIHWHFAIIYWLKGSFRRRRQCVPTPAVEDPCTPWPHLIRPRFDCEHVNRTCSVSGCGHVD